MGIIVSFEAAHKARQARNRQGLYQFQLGQQINVSESYICRIEHGGKSVEPDILAALARKLDINPKEFCQGCPLHGPDAA